MKVVATQMLKVETVCFQPESYPREKPRAATIEQYVDALLAGAEFPPIDLDVDGLVLLDGYHRWKAFQEAGATEIPVRLVDLEGLPRLLYAAGRNARHGDRLSMPEKKQVARALAAQGVKQNEIGRELGVSHGTVSAWVADIVQRHQRQRHGQVWWLHRLGWSYREIEAATGISKSEAERLQARVAELDLTEKLARGHAAGQIAEVEDLPPGLIEVLALEGLDDAARLAQLRIGLQPYDVWNFAGTDPRFGAEYPGRIPGQLVLHTLYFFTRPGDLVVDPMVGSGTSIDACAILGRRVYGYDVAPFAGRDDILRHDLLREGWPDHAAQAQLIFWDPPYYKKMDEAYSEESISRLKRDDYLGCFETAARSLSAHFAGRLALLCSDYTDEENPRENIFVYDYVRIFAQAGWELERRIQVPLTTQQVHPDVVNHFREQRRLARLARDLLILHHG